MQPVDTIITPKWLIPIEPFGSILRECSIAISGPSIIAIGPTERLLNQYQATEHLILPQHVLMPGFVNAHCHSPMVLMRGIADDVDLMTWLGQHIWPYEQKVLGPQFIQLGMALAMAEMLESGTTCFSEHYFYPDLIAKSVDHIGMRAQVGLWMGEVSNAWSQSLAHCYRNNINAFEQFHTHKRLSFAIAPHSPYQIGQGNWPLVEKLANELALGTHIHLHESKTEVDYCLALHQRRPLDHLKHHRLLHRPLQAVHMVHQVSEQDLNQLSAHHASVVTCPKSNLKLANGICDVNRFVKAGINVAIGTDGAASNNELDMLSELRLVALLSKAKADDPTAVSAYQALTMATLNGAKAMGLDDHIGSIVPDKYADLIAFDLSHLRTLSPHAIDSHLVYAANSTQVSHVFVHGRCLYRDGQHTTIDLAALKDEAKQWFKLYESTKT